MMPEFHERDDEHVAKKMDDLEPSIEDALDGRDTPDSLDESETPVVEP